MILVSLLVGLTGGIGSGKSLAAKFFAEQGAHIIDADQLSRELVQPGQPALKEIVSAFGVFILDETGNLDREKLAEIIFQNPQKKSTLEAILHPRIIAKEREKYSNISAEDPSAIVIIDAALLIESGNYKNVDKVIVVNCSEEHQVQRILSRNSLNSDQAAARIKNQMSLKEKIKYADFILDNNSQPQDLRRNVHEVYTKLMEIQ
ncbi:MAG: dephospho-CoA kinase [Nitrospinae bacterium CG22_combo_CG10-13_8_21_14_all_47_10]|nr:MAG: dephospho-CoA kinase [Nitrospinae bacterium CG22_combo_CG10-13_8_21_14_all_47_10]